jgi:hypothetical protein
MTMNVTGAGASNALWPGAAVRQREEGFDALVRPVVVERAGANPADVADQMRRAAVLRDAPAAGINGPDRAAAEAQQAALRSLAGTTNSLTVTTALAAYAAAAASAPRNPVLLPSFEAISDEPATPEGEPEATEEAPAGSQSQSSPRAARR